MILSDLLGYHELSGVQYATLPENDYGEYSNAMDFILDGKVYSAIDDPDDGYGSCLKKIMQDRISAAEISNRFDAVPVVGKYSDSSTDVIELVDQCSGRTVMAIGTDHHDEYYPCCILSFYPESMTINRKLRGRRILRHRI